VVEEALAAAEDPSSIPGAVSPVAGGEDGAPISATVEPIAGAPASTGDVREDEPHAVAVAAMVPLMEAVVPATPVAEAPLRAPEPPLDLSRVARLFGPYGPLLSRDRAVVVDWTAGPDVAVVCVAPQEISRAPVVRLAARLALALDASGIPSAPGPVRRVSLRGPEGAVVMTPLDGAVLVAAARRPGALALLEVLSSRLARPEASEEPTATEPGVALPASVRGPALVDLHPAPPGPPPDAAEPAVARAVRVETPAAWVDVVAPPEIEAESMGMLTGQLVAALGVGEAAGAATFHVVSVDLASHRVAIHPVQPDARPPRVVAVVGGRERPGRLGRRAERAARALRAAS
jgi:hypothetical protein